MENAEEPSDVWRYLEVAKRIRRTRTFAVYQVNTMKLYVTWLNGNRFKIDTLPKTTVEIMTLDSVHEYLYLKYGITGEIFYDEMNDWDKQNFIDKNTKELINAGL